MSKNFTDYVNKSMMKSYQTSGRIEKPQDIEAIHSLYSSSYGSGSLSDVRSKESILESILQSGIYVVAGIEFYCTRMVKVNSWSDREIEKLDEKKIYFIAGDHETILKDVDQWIEQHKEEILSISQYQTIKSHKDSLR